MSESLLSVEAHVINIEPYKKDALLDPDDERTGHADILYRLIKRLEDSGEEVFATAEVRVYFKRNDIPLDALISSALNRGNEALSQIVERYKPETSDVNTEQLWR